jgi:hypothetical protein
LLTKARRFGGFSAPALWHIRCPSEWT